MLDARFVNTRLFSYTHTQFVERPNDNSASSKTSNRLTTQLGNIYIFNMLTYTDKRVLKKNAGTLYRGSHLTSLYYSMVSSTVLFHGSMDSSIFMIDECGESRNTFSGDLLIRCRHHNQ